MVYKSSNSNCLLGFKGIIGLGITSIICGCLTLYMLYHNVYITDSLNFKLYQTKFNKSYGQDYNQRFENFKKSLSEIEKLNALESSKVYGLTEFADMSQTEFKETMTLESDFFYYLDSNFSCGYNQKKIHVNFDGRYPPYFDWRDSGKVGPVQNQKRCAACWAFSIVGAMEIMMAINKNEQHSEQLSVQEILDCSRKNIKKFGCSGGNVKGTLIHLCSSKKTVVYASQYPLTLYNEKCRLNEMKDIGVKLGAIVTISNIKEPLIPELIAKHGPVIAVLEMDTWQFYTGGIIYKTCNSGVMRHAVQIVGYDTRGEIPYYIIKNSWGKRFGIKGYVHVAMNEDVCKITQEVSVLNVYEKLP